MQTVLLYKITTTYEDPYFEDYWSLEPAHNEVHPATGLEYDDLTNGDPVEYVLPDGFSVGKTVIGETAIFNSSDAYVELETRGGEPFLADDVYIRLVKAYLDVKEG